MAKKQDLEETVDSVIDIAMSRLKDIIDVNTVVGKPVNASDSVTILPITKVSVGFVAGGGEIVARAKNCPKDPFAGGSGSGFVLTPIGFLVIEKSGVKYINCEEKTPIDEIIKLSSNIVNNVSGKKVNNEKNN